MLLILNDDDTSLERKTVVSVLFSLRIGAIVRFYMIIEHIVDCGWILQSFHILNDGFLCFLSKAIECLR